MNIIEAIYHRRAVRAFTGMQVASTTIYDLIQAAIQAPSAMNQQPWAFAVYQGQERLREYSVRAKAHYLGAVLPTFGLHGRGDTLTDPHFNIFHDAGTLLVVCARHQGLNPAEDCCLAAQNIMLAAHGAGLGTCPIGLARPWLNLPEVKGELGILPGLSVVFPLVVGYPAGHTAEVPREPPEIVFWK
jgi:nitroreductase